MVYLDNSSTTYPKPECVYQALDEANRTLAFNAGRGIYPCADKAQKIIDETRELISSFLGKSLYPVVFTSSATDAINQLLYGINFEEGDYAFVSPFEHNAVLRVLHLLEERKHINIVVIPFDKAWNLIDTTYENLLHMYKPKVVISSLISNVTGFKLPYSQIFDMAKNVKAITILDASQGFGVVEINNKENTDYIVFDGHKTLYASFGVGGFICLKSHKLIASKAGGTGSDSLNLSMPTDLVGMFEPGSHNTVAIASLNASCKWLKTVDVASKESILTSYLIDELSKLNNIHMFLPDRIENVFGTVSFCVDGYSAEEVGSILSDEFDIAVRTGFHCAAYVHEFIRPVRMT